MKIVDLGRIDVGERSGEDVRLFSVVALQTDAVAGRNTASSKFGRSTTSIVLPEAYLRPSARRSARVVFCAFQLFIPGLSYSGGLLPRNWHEIDRSGSPDRDGERHIDIASDRIRVRADRMSTLDEPFGGLLVDACNGHGKRGSQDEASRVISAKVDPGDDVDILIGKAVAGVPAQMKE